MSSSLIKLALAVFCGVFSYHQFMIEHIKLIEDKNRNHLEEVYNLMQTNNKEIWKQHNLLVSNVNKAFISLKKIQMDLLLLHHRVNLNSNKTDTDKMDTDTAKMNSDTDKMDTDKMDSDTDKMDTDKMDTDTDKMDTDKMNSDKTDKYNLNADKLDINSTFSLDYDCIEQVDYDVPCMQREKSPSIVNTIWCSLSRKFLK